MISHENIQLTEVSPELLRHHRSSTIHVITSSRIRFCDCKIFKWNDGQRRAQGSPKREAFFENLLFHVTVIGKCHKTKTMQRHRQTHWKTQHALYFEMPKTQAFQVWSWIPSTGHHRHHSCPIDPLGPCLTHFMSHAQNTLLLLQGRVYHRDFLFLYCYLFLIRVRASDFSIF